MGFGRPFDVATARRGVVLRWVCTLYGCGDDGLRDAAGPGCRTRHGPTATSQCRISLKSVRAGLIVHSIFTGLCFPIPIRRRGADSSVGCVTVLVIPSVVGCGYVSAESRMDGLDPKAGQGARARWWHTCHHLCFFFTPSFRYNKIYFTFLVDSLLLKLHLFVALETLVSSKKVFLL